MPIKSPIPDQVSKSIPALASRYPWDKTKKKHRDEELNLLISCKSVSSSVPASA
jgi:hypothetical protein